MFGSLWEGTEDDSRRARLRTAATGLAAVAVAALLAACGGESSADKEPAGNFDVGVTAASFPTLQRLGQTSLLKLSFKNEGEKTVPNLVVYFTVAGEQGTTASLPFGVHERQAGLANPTRPVWVLAEHFPKLAGPSAGEKGGATTSSPKTFAFGPLKPGETTSRGLEAERGAGGQVHPALPGRRRPRHADEGEDGERRRPGRHLRRRDHRADPGHRSHRRRRNRRSRRRTGRSSGGMAPPPGLRSRSPRSSSPWRCRPAAPRPATRARPARRTRRRARQRRRRRPGPRPAGSA